MDEKNKEHRKLLKYICNNINALHINDRMFIGGLILTNVSEENGVNTSNGCQITITDLSRTTTNDIIQYMKSKLE